MQPLLKRSAALVAACFAVAACTRTLHGGADDPLPSPAPTPGFTSPDAADDVETGGRLTSYCPSNKCPAGRTTCPSSRFTCDVNLLTDRQNCGECGFACPGDTGRETFECVDGRCVMQCNAYPRALDCDGFADNGCEASPGSPRACATCGDDCGDDPCVPIGQEVFQCGCPSGLKFCDQACFDIANDDRNCGACANRCDPTGDGGTLFPNTYFGCRNGGCGTVKCQIDFGECDGKFETGCETRLTTHENCGGCGNACGPDQECRINPVAGYYECQCPASQTCQGICADLATDRFNCGVCDNWCRPPTLNAIGICVSGQCKFECVAGRADCNGNLADDCETNTDNDPRNCGGCGVVCSAIAGQACVGGRCVVEPCEDVEGDAGGPK